MGIMSESIQSATQGETADPVESVPQPATDTAPDTGQEQQAEPAEQVEADEKPKQTPWFQRRIDELTREKHEERRQKEQLAGYLHNIQQGQQPNQQQNEGQAPTGYIPVADLPKYQAQVAETMQFHSACDAVADAGDKLPRFSEAVARLITIGVETQNPRDPLMQVITALGPVEGAAAFYALGNDPDEAMRIARLPFARMAVEVAKMAAKPSAAAPVSRLPSPITPISAARTEPGGEPDAKRNPAEWATWFRNQYRTR